VTTLCGDINPFDGWDGNIECADKRLIVLLVITTTYLRCIVQRTDDVLCSAAAAAAAASVYVSITDRHQNTEPLRYLLVWLLHSCSTARPGPAPTSPTCVLDVSTQDCRLLPADLCPSARADVDDCLVHLPLIFAHLFCGVAWSSTTTDPTDRNNRSNQHARPLSLVHSLLLMLLVRWGWVRGHSVIKSRFVRIYPFPPPLWQSATPACLPPHNHVIGWLLSTVVERRYFAGKLSLSSAWPAAVMWPLMWVNRPLQLNQLGQLSLSSFRGR